jgi:hypothetical protein
MYAREPELVPNSQLPSLVKIKLSSSSGVELKMNLANILN